MNYPKDLRPVLAEIHHVNSLGVSQWREVIYYDENMKCWRGYAGSKTFDDGETVEAWEYVDNIVLNSVYG
jgi:hypothetical protein